MAKKREADLSLTDTQKELVRGTWAQVLPISDEAARLFYSRLFEIDPSVEPLFAETNMDQQGKKLMQTIDVAVAGLDNLDRISPAVEDLGRRHVDYGVREEHYETVGAALLWTLRQGLGKDFTPEAEEAWAETYGALATLMKNAAARTRTSSL